MASLEGAEDEEEVPRAPDTRVASVPSSEWRIYHFENHHFMANVEIACLALAVGGVPFQETRVSRDVLPGSQMSSWDQMKASGRLPYDQLPLLVMGRAGDESLLDAAASPNREEDPLILCQTNAIIRACGLHSGLMDAKDPLRYAKVDEILCAIQDVKSKFGPSLFQQDAGEKERMRCRLAKTVLIPWLENIEQLLAANEAVLGAGYCAGASLTIADLALDVFLTWIDTGVIIGINPSTVDLSGFPRICSIRERVQATPRVQDRRQKLAASGCRFVPEQEWVAHRRVTA